VKYCNAVCKKVHKKKHKKDCEEHVRLETEKHDEELRIAAELHDKELFKQPPPAEDCPICFERMPSVLPLLSSAQIYMSCCGKTVCSGCCYAPLYDNQGNEVDNKKCPFCRTPAPFTYKKEDEEISIRLKKRLDADDPAAMYNLGCYYRDGQYRYPQNYTKALELWHQAGKFGYSEAYVCIGYAYINGRGAEIDEKKARHYWELAAMSGSVVARYNLGVYEHRADNMNRALKHFMIATRDGCAKSLKEIQDLFSKGHATKDEYTKALCTYQVYLGEIKTDQRDKAAAADDDHRYY